MADQASHERPRWLSTDLRDGNQSLIEPMGPEAKRALFDLLVRIGFKEIEIGFPATSLTDYDFVRSLVEDDAIPEDVTISVLTQSREDLIDRTLDACVGIPRATVHLYNALSPLFREVVFRMSRQDVHELAVDGIRMVMARAEKVLTDDTVFGFEYSPEIFVDTEREYSLEVCEAVMDVWQPEADREIILNLPATVDRATPNVYADQIEWVSRNLSRRDVVALGSSPLTRGAQIIRECTQVAARIIPAYAGCTIGLPMCVHLHGGSSPLTRGARMDISPVSGLRVDHPRLRGVHMPVK